MKQADLYHLARLARHHGESWRTFWARHRDAILAELPERRERARLADALQSVILLGVGPPVEELPS
jgi:hypothetical protein